MSGSLCAIPLTINASLLAFGQHRRLQVHCAFTLAGEVHRFQIVAVAALEGIICFHTRPFVLREFEALANEVVARIDCAEECPAFTYGPALSR